MAPTKHPSAWRLNKAEQATVEDDLRTWEASLSADVSLEEKSRLREDERKRLTRLVQQAKHDQSLVKQSKAGAKNKAKAKAAPSDLPEAEAAGGAPDPGCNQDYYERLKQDLAVIYKELGADLTEIQPTPIAAKDVYDLSKAQVALQCHGSYISSCNLFWLDCWKNPAPGVPLNRVRVSQLADFYFPEGRQNNFFHKLLEVQVDSSGLTDKPSGLVVITPLEICHAIFLKAAADLSKPGTTAACKALMEKLEGRKLSDQEVVQLLKNKHLMTAQKGTGHSAVDASNYCEWNFTAAKTIVTKLQSDQVITEIVNKQENLKGSDSCFNSLVKLEKLAQRPSCLASRRFIFQLIADLLCHGVIRDDDLSKKDMIGSANNPGTIHLYEFKWRCLSYILDIMSVQAKLKDADRVLLKEHLRDPVETRSNTVDNIGWQGSLTKSSLEALTFIQDVVCLKQYDNILRQGAKPNSHPEILNEMETIQEAWTRVVALQAMELVDEDGEGTAAEAETADGLLKLARKTPNALPKGSPQYWKAIANQTVRMYCAFVTEANSAAGMTAAVEKENLPRGEAGKSCILCHLDTRLLGESTGPGCQDGLRKVWRPDETLVQKLLGSTLIGLGAQQDKSGKCTCPGEAVLAAVFDPLNILPKGFLKDSSSQTMWLCFNEVGTNFGKFETRCSLESDCHFVIVDHILPGKHS
ncbi:Uncharacterized protein (Fragment) [Durusdinium trenchii]|uniref:Uncharacterized protein n=1 Tax=Durusdinium trenchii TaxID=1381693 RepID=A0ABP0HRZ7_9DINO